jgi:hypothetical protein
MQTFKRFLCAIFVALADSAHADSQLAATSTDQVLEALALASSSTDYWELSSGFDSSRGTYGLPQATTVYYVPLALAYHTGAWTLSVESGYVHVKGPLNYVDILNLLEGAAASPASTVHGFADTHLGVKYALVEDLARGLFIDVGAKLRTPTASTRKGLGTGHVAGDLQVDITKTLGQWTVFGGAEYGLRDSRDADRNPWTATAGIARSLTARWSAGTFYSWRQAAVSGGEGAHEAFVYTSYAFNDHNSFTLYGATGFSRESVDREVGVRYSYRWP